MPTTKTPKPTTADLNFERAKLSAAVRHFQQATTSTDAQFRTWSERLATAERGIKAAPIANVPHFEHDATQARQEIAGCELYREEMKNAEQRLRERLKQINDTLRGTAAAN